MVVGLLRLQLVVGGRRRLVLDELLLVDAWAVSVDHGGRTALGMVSVVGAL